MKFPLVPLLVLCTALPAVAATAPTPSSAALKKIEAADVLEHITMLSSDEFEGRAPGSHGETVTINYLQEQFKQLGLEPGNPDGGYLQPVPMVSVSSHTALSYHAGAQPAVTLREGDDYVAWSPNAVKRVAPGDSELVFVGYGISAPEYRWDDYKGADLRGKTLLMLINDPPLPDPKHPGQLDPAMFGGSAMSYYGRWNYKFEMAAKLGAAGALIVHETRPAGYPYEVVRNSLSRENFALKSKAMNPAFPPLPGWLQLDRARELIKASGHDFDALKKAAQSRDFKPVPLGVTLNMSALNSWREVPSNNVVARITGSDPQLKDEVVVYSAHWDHFGIDDSLPGPRSGRIFHGARDNASGVAALLAVARAYKALPVAPKRSILFILTTGEERGLLGAQYYARHPLYPLARTLVDINVDGLNLWGRTRDVLLSGMGKSSADDIVVSVARGQGRLVRPNNSTGFGSFYHGDQLEFARAGVPVIYPRGGAEFVGKNAAALQARVANYFEYDYHMVSDVVQPNWDLSGALQDIALIFEAGYRVADGKDAPQWKANAEFKAARDAAPAQATTHATK